jgi:hypothetical protein
MISHNIKIIDFKILYLILDEIKPYLPFTLSYHKKDLKLEKKQNLEIENFIVVVNRDFNLDDLNIDDRCIYVLNHYPIQIEKLINDLNISLIKQRYSYQAKIVIKDYILDINSRNISKKDKTLQLTEREIDVILFLKEKKTSQKVSQLQKTVWRYSSDLETHTVETHIYRLRKKMSEIFNDQNFIKSDNDGYNIE